MRDSKTRLAAEAKSLPELAEGIRNCRSCRLWQGATQAVCGEGHANARVMLIGEQPGDREDLTGKPFVGPVLADRGKIFESELGPKILVTVHPSSILRMPPGDRPRALELFVRDLAKAKPAK